MSMRIPSITPVTYQRQPVSGIFGEKKQKTFVQTIQTFINVYGETNQSNEEKTRFVKAMYSEFGAIGIPSRITELDAVKLFEDICGAKKGVASGILKHHTTPVNVLYTGTSGSELITDPAFRNFRQNLSDVQNLVLAEIASQYGYGNADLDLPTMADAKQMDHTVSPTAPPLYTQYNYTPQRAAYWTEEDTSDKKSTSHSNSGTSKPMSKADRIRQSGREDWEENEKTNQAISEQNFEKSEELEARNRVADRLIAQGANAEMRDTADAYVIGAQTANYEEGQKRLSEIQARRSKAPMEGFNAGRAGTK